MAEREIVVHVDSGNWWYLQIQQLLLNSYEQGTKVDFENWWKDGIWQIQEQYEKFSVSSGKLSELDDLNGDWWKSQIKDLLQQSIRKRSNIRHWWYETLPLLLYKFDFKEEMMVNFNKLLRQVVVATAKDYLESVQLLERSLVTFIQQESHKLENKLSEARQEEVNWCFTKVQGITKLLEDFLTAEVNVEYDNEDVLYKQIIEAADQIFFVHLLSETFISLGIQVNFGDSWNQILQTAAYRQLVVLVGVELFLETVIKGGKCSVILEDSSQARHETSYRQLVSVRKLPLPLDTTIKLGMQVTFDDSYQIWLKTANRHLVSVKRVRQLLEAYISQELLLNEYSWKQVMQTEFEKDYYKELSKFVSQERETKGVYPHESQVFNWTKFCRINDVKVVIFGQDPYHRPGEAHGLSFSVPHGVPLPASLFNIYRKLKIESKYELPKFEPPGHGTLTGWAVQGVLLLNSILTVRAGIAKSHANKGWEEFTTAVIKWLNNNLHGVVFMLWGAEARKSAALIDQDDKVTCHAVTSKHKIIESSHPSPKSAYYSTKECKSFMEVSHFLECNTYLRQKGKTPIDWSWLPALEA